MKTVLDPVPAYVIKTLDLDSKEKVFINVCTDKQVPPPDTLDSSDIALQVTQGADWVVPIVVSASREDVDKSGNSCCVFDCCMNPEVVVLGIQDPSVKVLTVETCLELVEHRGQRRLGRDYKFPKMKSKGRLLNTEYDASAPSRDLPQESPHEPVHEPEQLLALGSRPQAPTRKLEIEIVDSQDEGSFYFHVYRGPYSGPGPRPSHAIELSGMQDEISISGRHVSAPGKASLDLGFVPAKYDAFYNQEEDTTYVMLWKA